MRTDNDGLGLGPELAAFGVLPAGVHGNAGKDPGAAAFLGDFGLWHVFSIVQLGRGRVNCVTGQRAQKSSLQKHQGQQRVL